MSETSGTTDFKVGQFVKPIGSAPRWFNVFKAYQIINTDNQLDSILLRDDDGDLLWRAKSNFRVVGQGGEEPPAFSGWGAWA